MVLTRFLEHIKDTSCHGVGHFANAGSKRAKTFWFCFTIVCLAGLGYFITVRTYDFLNSSVIRTTDYISVDNLDFPQVTVCSKDSYDDSELKSKYLPLVMTLKNVLILAREYQPKLFKRFLLQYVFYVIKNTRTRNQSDHKGLRMHYTEKILANFVTDNNDWMGLMDPFWPYEYYYGQ